jgi:hypothetical protein
MDGQTDRLGRWCAGAKPIAKRPLQRNLCAALLSVQDAQKHFLNRFYLTTFFPNGSSARSRKDLVEIGMKNSPQALTVQQIKHALSSSDPETVRLAGDRLEAKAKSTPPMPRSCRPHSP